MLIDKMHLRRVLTWKIGRFTRSCYFIVLNSASRMSSAAETGRGV